MLKDISGSYSFSIQKLLVHRKFITYLIITIALVVGGFSIFGIDAAESATVQTDEQDYSPGETVVMTGSGWQPGETVSLVLHEDPANCPDRTLYAVADASGNIYNDEFAPEPHDLGITFTLTATGLTSGLTAQTTFTDKAQANLDQCANGGVGDPPAQCIGAAWQNGNLNDQQAHYQEGQSIPYRAILSDLTAGAVYTLEIGYDTTQGGKHAIDYLTSFDRTETTAQPCTGVPDVPAGACNSPYSWPIPPDANLGTVPQIAGNFILYNGTITGDSGYTLNGNYTGNSETTIVLTFTANADGTAVLAWGGHIATRLDWGVNNSAVAIDGSPYHMRLNDFTCSNDNTCNVGNQDRSLSNSAVIFPASVTIIKNSIPDDAQDFSFTTTGDGLSNFQLDDDGDNSNTLSNTKTFNNLVTFGGSNPRTVTEGDPSPGFELTNIQCIETSGGLDNEQNSTIDLSTRTATIILEEAEVVSCTFTNNRVPAKLIVIKHVINDNGGTSVASDFTISVTGDNPNPYSFAGAESPGVEVQLGPGSYSVSETGPDGYTESQSADCTGSINAGETKTCTITNDDDEAQLIVIKHVINDNGGTAVASDFTLDSGGTNDSPDNFAGAEAPGTTVTLDAGSYNVTETGPSGYTASYSANCSGTIANGQTKTCTVTNDDKAAHLIVIKHVINDNGGTAVASDFTLDSGGTNDSPDNFAGAEAPGTDVTLDAGSYNVTETGPSGYTASFSSDCSGTIANGQTKTCTVTNDDQAAQLIVIKHVINDNGGTAVSSNFTLDSGGANDTPDNFPGAEAPGTTVTLDAGSYNVTETGPSGYTASFSSDCSGTIANGQTKTCTVTNDDIAPQLIIIKHVINDNGGTAVASDFTLDSGGANDTPDDFAGAEAPGTTVTLNAGAYSVTETGPPGYTASYSADCSGSIALGETKTCTVTNDDQAAHLIVIKHVINNNGGVAVASDFTLDSGGANDTPDNFPGAESPGTDVTLDAGSYDVTETGPSGYTASYSADCSGTIANGQTKTCTVTNDDQAAQLIVIKHVINDNGGTANASNFTLDSGGANDTPDNFAGAEAPGTTVSLDAGAYNVTESGPAGYAASFSADCSGSIANGETKTCTVTNDDISPTLTVNKVCNPTNDTGTFNLLIDGSAGTTGSNKLCGQSTGAVQVNAGLHTVSESAAGSTDLTDYVTTISGDCDASGNVSLALAENKTCTITNVKKGNVTVLKTTNGVVNPTLDLRFVLKQGTETIETLSTLNDSDGLLEFTTKLVPGDTYTVCETNVPAGFSSAWKLDGVIISPYNPDASLNPPQDLGNRCYDFTVEPDATAAFVIDNTRPGGAPRTIGYWKNWNRCTGGGQDENADRNGGAANGFFLLEDLLPQLIGDFNITACEQGVKVLSKQDQSGKNRSSDAAYELAAQLLAAQLNLAAGAETCSAVQQAVLDAQALLAGIDFNGSGGYLGPKVKGNLLILRNTALSLASTLDQYNNGNLCL